MERLLSRALFVLVLALMVVSVSACAAVAGIFKAGVWVGIIVAVIVVGLLFALLGRG